MQIQSKNLNLKNKMVMLNADIVKDHLNQVKLFYGILIDFKQLLKDIFLNVNI